ncbi:helix-turn-helix domain-containing protein [Streptomyces omiyaensis]|uniref:hypothetical protein n=1 Tax=Streptomyces omiyaensis TaxID=68247 RepID=UPI0036FDB85D
MTTHPAPGATPLTQSRLDGIRHAVESGATGPATGIVSELLAEVDRLQAFVPIRPMDCPLSGIELDVVLGLALGETAVVTAERTGRAITTIKTHRLRIHKRLRLHRATHVVAVAMANGWITPTDVLRKGR